MAYEQINLEKDDRGVATLTLNRPDKHNAMSAQMIAELTDAAKVLANDASVRVVVLAGNGASFCAGGDLAWMKEQMSATREERIVEARKLAHMLNALNTLPKPLLGRIHGNAFGGGVGMAAVCDLVVCSKNVLMGLTEVKLGLIPATISPYVLARMGEGKARQVFMSARLFDAERAKELGLASIISDDLDTVIEKEISYYLKAAPQAVAASKALAQSLGTPITQDVIDSTIERLADTWENPEAMEGIGAFFEKRAASWVV